MNTKVNEKDEMFHVERVSSPIYFGRVGKEMRAALESGQKRVVRLPVTIANTNTSPGLFINVQWETGRVRRSPLEKDGFEWLRVRCDFPQGRTRMVSVMPKIDIGHLLWVRNSCHMHRRRSTLTLAVTSIGISRLNDITDEQALAEGVGALPARVRKLGSPRRQFAWLWDQMRGAGAWSRNEWVWRYEFDLYPMQVDRFIASGLNR